MNSGIILSGAQIRNIKHLADNTRKAFGVYADVPVGGDILDCGYIFRFSP